MIIASALSAAIAWLAADQAAAQSASLQTCRQGDPKQRVEACSAVLSQAKISREITVSALRERAAAYRALRELEKARADLDRTIEMAPRDLAMRLERGAVHFDLGDDEKAGRDFAAVIAADAKSAAAYIGRAAVLDRAGVPDAALRDLDTALGIAPRNARALANRAHIHLRNHDMRRATADADQAVELAPSDPWAHEVRGLVRRSGGDAQGALADFDAVIRVGRHGEVLRGHLLRAGARLDLRDLEGAIADYDRVLSADKSSIEALAGRAWALHLSGRHHEAIADATDALRLDPSLAAALDTRAHAALSLGDLAAAQADFDRALALDPKLASARLGRSRLHIAAGNVREATADLEAAIAAPQEAPEALQISRQALALLTGLRDREATMPRDRAQPPAAPPQAPPSAVPSAVARAEPAVWALDSTRAECRLAAVWPDRSISFFSRAGIVGPSPDVGFAVTAASRGWPPGERPDAPGAIEIALTPSAQPLDVAGVVSVRTSAAGVREINLGPLQLSAWRKPLETARNVALSLDGTSVDFPAGDLWAWLPAFEQCARALPR